MIKFSNVSLKYHNGAYAVKDLNLFIEKGEFVFIVGKTGAGKSTLFRLLTREIISTNGSIKVFGENIAFLGENTIPYYRRQLGVVFQDFKLLEDKNVYENVAFAQEVIGVSPFRIKKRVLKLLSYIGMRGKVNKYPSELSGGEKQKVAISRAIINNPKILLADEPTGNLDQNSSKEVMDILENINKNGTTVVVITHDLSMVERMNKRIIKIDKGELIDDIARR